MYQKSNGDSKLVNERNSGELQFPNEGALLFGGRVGEHMGFLFETQLVEASEVGWASFKIPFVYEVSETKLSVVPFTTDARRGLRIRPFEHGRDEDAKTP